MGFAHVSWAMPEATMPTPRSEAGLREVMAAHFRTTPARRAGAESSAGEYSSRVSATRTLLIVTGAYPFVGGGLALVGWAFGIQRLMAWDGSALTMKAN